MIAQLNSTEAIVVTAAVILIVVVGVVRLFIWLANAPVRPDPWDAEAGVDLDAAEARPLCTRCLSPHEETDWFCPQCGKAVSPTTNWMPYLDELSLGDVLRHGTGGDIPLKPTAVIGYVLLGGTQYLIFAPLYWLRLWSNVRRLRARPPVKDDNDSRPD